MNTKQLITDYLEEARLMQVATSRDNQPWACSVYFAYDDTFSLFWISLPSTRHSEEIRANQKVAGTIVLPYTPGSPVRGLQFEGIAQELHSGNEFLHALDVYATRMKMSNSRKENIIKGKDGHVVYRIQPKSFVLFDTKNFPDSPRQELQLQ